MTRLNSVRARARYYGTVPGFAYQDESMYDVVLRNVSLDACAETCYDEYGAW
jgi:hypothetical protein